MQGAAINIAFGTVLVFLFGTVAWVRRPDDRARCWFAGWLSLLGSFVAQFAGLRATGWESIVFASIEVDLLATAGIFWVVSSAIPVHGRKFGIELWLVLAIPTVLCLDLVAANLQSRWILLAAVAVRQGLSIAAAANMRRLRPRFAMILVALCAAAAAVMFYFILHGQARLVVPVVLTELYFVAGIDAWNKSLAPTIGMRVSSLGLLLCAAAFPLAEIAHRIWPQVATDSDIWNPPKSVVAVGMMLLVFEEEVRAARLLARDYRLLFDNNPNPLWIVDVETLRFLAANEAACAIHGYTREEFLRLRLLDIVHPDLKENTVREVRNPIPVPNRASRHIRKDGTEFPVDLTSHIVIFQGKTCRFTLGLDVTKRESLERRLEYHMDHDALTGLANRRAFEEQLTAAVSRAARAGMKLAIICFDICHFKRLNDVYGPRAGDETIRYIAGVLSADTRAIDFVARTGDDEFAMVLTGLRDLTFAEEIAGHFNERFKAPVAIGEYEIQLSFSLGVAVCPDDSTDAMALWHLAESALRRAQTRGGSQAVWLSPQLRAGAEKTADIAAGMSKLLEEDRFSLVYQPIYARDGMLSGLEALLRLDHPRFGATSPLTVVRTAEETGLIEQLGQWMMERACRQMRSWIDEGIRLVPVAINISSMQLMRRGFAERLAQMLDRYGVGPQWIHLEITETAAMDNLEAVSGEMTVLSALGCKFSIDDFGTGHSSLGRLRQLPISILKIDRSFIEHLCVPGEKGASCTIVQAILSMAHALGLQVVAEGVETKKQLNCLRHLQCDFFQGFLLSRPLRPEKIPATIARAHAEFRSAPLSLPCMTDGERVEEARCAGKT